MHATPFIRYRTEDLAVFKGWGCEACGRPYQIWERIEGRLQELIRTRSGRLVSTSMLNMHDDTYDGMKQFQFHQSSAGTVTFRYVPRDGVNGTVDDSVRERLLAKLGNDVDLVMERVAEIPLTKRGKHRLLVQELDLAEDHPALSKAIKI
jgi:phenylacetate-CoA ligase